MVDIENYMKRKLLKISYDGTDFNGWQSQKSGRTVQQTIESAISSIAKKKVSITGAGRTDAGVHALAQYAHFDLDLAMNNDQILKAINTQLPRDVRILNVKDVSPDFHARFDASKRVYRFVITRQLTPFNRNYRSFLPRFNLYQDRILECLKIFKGNHDFSSYSKANPDNKTTICTIDEFKLETDSNDLVFTISADRFLHNMVRRIIGTIVNVTSKKLNNALLAELLSNKDPANQMIFTAPPQGLYLLDVLYL